MIACLGRKTMSIAAAVFVLAGCGSSGGTTSVAERTATTPPQPTPAALSETVRVVGPGSRFSSSGSATPGDIVEFRTLVPAAGRPRAVKVDLKFSQGPVTTWTATASAQGQTSTATLASAQAKPLTLVGLRYSCALPPAPTFCPAHDVRSSAGHIAMQFSASTAVPITLVAKAGPAAGLPPAGRQSTLVVPAYAVTTTVLATSRQPAKTGATVRFGPTATAQPGDEVVLRARVTGGVNGAAQPVTLSFDQGPAKTIDVSAAVPGGTTSTATIISASGNPIALVLPRYECFVPPVGTFCPALNVTAASHRYAVTFASATTIPPITLVAQVQTG